MVVQQLVEPRLQPRREVPSSHPNDENQEGWPPVFVEKFHQIIWYHDGCFF
jgi:hypothetical protein